MKFKRPIGSRIVRFLKERYRQRERPGYMADFVLWGLIVFVSTWGMFPLAQALELLR